MLTEYNHTAGWAVGRSVPHEAKVFVVGVLGCAPPTITFTSWRGPCAAAIAKQSIPVFAKKGETLKEYWEYVDKIFTWSDGTVANMILDDGGDATSYIIMGAKAENGEPILVSPNNEEEEALKVSTII